MARESMHVTEAEKERQHSLIREIRDLPHRPQTYHVVTYGCQMNAHDSEIIAGMLEEMGMTPAAVREEADFVIFNTCCVRDNAERRALGNVTWLKEVRKQKPGMIIAVCGCMVQEPGMAEKIMKQYSFVDLAFGTANLHQFPELLYEALNSDRSVVAVSDEDRIAEGLPVRRLRQDAACHHHVRVRQFLLFLHRSLCPGKGKKPQTGGYPSGGPGSSGKGRSGNHAARTEREQLRKGTGNPDELCRPAEGAGCAGNSPDPVYDQSPEGSQ